MSDRPFRLAYLVSHPIQYQAPLLRRLAKEPGLDLTVFFASDHSVAGYADEGFGGARVRWDVPLLEGYKSEFLPIVRPVNTGGLTAPTNRGIVRALRRGKFDAIWVHGYWNINSLVAMATAKILRTPVLLRAESTLVDRNRGKGRLLGKSIFFSVLKHFVSAVLPIGTLNRQYWNHYLGKQFPAFTMPYAVDNEYFQSACRTYSATREEFREELGLKPGRPVILYASKLMERKRCIDLVDAYLGMKPLADGEHPYLLIVGDGEERSNIEARIRNAGENNVRFFGFQNQSQLGRFYDLCDIFVLPSMLEPFGLVVNEVMNAGRTVVVSDEVGCHPDLLRDGRNGRVFRAGNVSDLREILESLVAEPETCRQMGKTGLEIINNWSFDQDIAALKQALATVAGFRPQTVEVTK